MPDISAISVFSWMALLIILSAIWSYYMARDVGAQVDVVAQELYRRVETGEPGLTRFRVRQIILNTYALYFFLPLFLGYLGPAIVTLIVLDVTSSPHLFLLLSGSFVILFMMLMGAEEGKRLVREIEPD